MDFGKISENTMPAIQQYRLGDFILEATKQRVRHRDGQTLDLSPRLFAALRFFVEHADELLDRDTLMAALWPKVFVEENNLSQVISGLRRALGDDGESACYIETVPRRGFRFVAQVTTDVADGSAVDQFPPGLAASRRRREGTTVAVLPFVPLLREASDELLELGMADSLIARLSTLSNSDPVHRGLDSSEPNWTPRCSRGLGLSLSCRSWAAADGQDREPVARRQ